MSGTHEGGLKTAQTNKEKYGADFYKIQGAKGGSTKTPLAKGFASMPPHVRRELGSIGGKISRRKYEQRVQDIGI